MVIQKWFKNRQSVIARKATNTMGERPVLPPTTNNNNSNTLKAPDQSQIDEKKNKKLKEEEKNKDKDESEREGPSETSEKKKERRKRGNYFIIYSELIKEFPKDKRKKMSTSFSQDNIQVNNDVKGSEDTLFKNKLLLQSFQQSEKSGTNSSMDKNEDQNKKLLKEELNKAMEQKKAVEEKLLKGQNEIEKLLASQGFVIK